MFSTMQLRLARGTSDHPRRHARQILGSLEGRQFHAIDIGRRRHFGPESTVCQGVLGSLHERLELMPEPLILEVGQAALDPYAIESDFAGFEYEVTARYVIAFVGDSDLRLGQQH